MALQVAPISDGLTIYQGKELERMNEEKLESVQRRATEERIRVGRQLNEEMESFRKIQEELNAVNERYEIKRREAEALRPRQSTFLSAEQRGRISRITEQTVAQFIDMRPRNRDEKIAIDVRFLPGKESVGNRLPLGGEGARSLLATFQMNFDGRVSDLAEQAAKYWGLDPNNVFFLDLDSRVVPDRTAIEDIALPPAPDRPEPSEGGASPASTEVVSRITGSTEEQEKYPYLLGLNYQLTLVRGGTILTTEDMSKPRGEKWIDFTFQEEALEKELEETRKKHGEAAGGSKKAKMDDIPSLYDLQQLGKDKKMKRRMDTRCRLFEFGLFIACELLFFFVAKPDTNFTIRVNLVAQHIEETYLKTEAFEEITTSGGFSEYLTGTLQTALVSQGMASSNLFVVGALGYLYAPIEGAVEGVQWCETETSAATTDDDDNSTRLLSEGDGSINDEDLQEFEEDELPSTFLAAKRLLQDSSNASTSTDSSCVAAELKYCTNARSIAILGQAMSSAVWVPTCQTYRSRDIVSSTVSYRSFGNWGFARGEVENWDDGVQVLVNYTSKAGYLESIDSFLTATDSQGRDYYLAKSIVSFIFSPSLNTILVYQQLMEHTMAGTVVSSFRKTVLPLNTMTTDVVIGWVLVLLLSVIVLLLELRRLTGRPKRCFWEGERSKCSVWIVVHALLPVMLLATFILNNLGWLYDNDQMASHSDGPRLTFDAMTTLFEQAIFNSALSSLEMVSMITMNMICYRFLLLFFPQLVFTATMVKRLGRPLGWALVFFSFAFLGIALFMFCLFSPRVYAYRNLTATFASTLRLMMGGVQDWHNLYKYAPALTTILVGLFFVVVTLFLDNLTLAIILSHKKERDLEENAPNHSYWSSEKSKLLGKDFNPARAGWDFSKNPRSPRNVESK